ncbi:methyltransferase [Morganella psychrotolerans]|uniref:methyltransferase n=1 Tax=Morganella psychrotolerans TaxID=368603 RepID=UPI0039B0753F
MSQNIPMTPAEEKAALRVMDIAMSFTLPGCLRTASQLHLADHLAKEPLSVNTLAERTKSQPALLHKVFRMLTANGIFTAYDNDLYGLNTEAEFLKADHPYSQRHTILMLTDETLWKPVGRVTDAIQGTPPFEDCFGESFYEYHEKHQGGDYNFPSGMSALSEVENYFVVNTYEFPENSRVMDIAGGLGGLLLRILRANPSLHGILLDRPHVLSDNRLSGQGIDSRWTAVSGNLFEALPESDIYILKNIMQDWQDERALVILNNCRESMRKDSKLLIIEPIIYPVKKLDSRHAMDILCLTAFPNGGERTIPEFEALLAKAGLKINRLIPTGCYVSILEVVKA